jgi:hypothetical protein
MKSPPDDYTEQEAAKRRDKVLSVMLNTPPQTLADRRQSRVRNRKKAAGAADRRQKPDPAS